MPALLRAIKKVPRRNLPWRMTRDPYKVLVSEMMLQQTQVDRVVPFYTRFVRQFPTSQKLAKAPLSKVLKAWQGLGYNRRAVFLQRSAKLLSKKSSGLPYRASSRSRARLFSQGVIASLSTEFLENLPGVGPYTARAVAAFAFNKPEIFVETNIRTVFLYHFSRLSLGRNVLDKEILPLVEKALKKSKMQPREFYARLMDYGAVLKRQGIKLNNKSAHYTKQSKFEGSYRQLRGAVLRELLKRPMTKRQLSNSIARAIKTKRPYRDVTRVLANLSSEGLVELKRNRFSIVD
jgi:A/G-specific adenine glycosylase